MKLRQQELESQQLVINNQNMERKVESLMKFLEHERRLRHEMEDQVKQYDLRERDVQA